MVPIEITDNRRLTQIQLVQELLGFHANDRNGGEL